MDANHAVRRDAVSAIQGFKLKKAPIEILSLLDDSDVMVQRNTVVVLGEVGDGSPAWMCNPNCGEFERGDDNSRLCYRQSGLNSSKLRQRTTATSIHGSRSTNSQ